MEATKVTKKEFRQILNQKYGVEAMPQGDSKRFKAVTREYGDYLYFQDRDMFNDLYREFMEDGK